MANNKSSRFLGYGFWLIVVAVSLFALITSCRHKAREQAIVNDVKHLIAKCQEMAAPIKVGDNSYHFPDQRIDLVGKALVWDMTTQSRSGAHAKLPSEIQATSADTPITVFMVLGERKVEVGTYSISHEPAYRQYKDIAVAYWPDKKPAGMWSVVSKEPRLSRPVEHQPEYGDPNEPIANWIATLPRSAAESEECVKRMIGICNVARLWAREHDWHMPLDLLSMSNRLVMPLMVICPSDRSRRNAAFNENWALNWDSFTPAKSSYEIVTSGLKEGETNGVFLRCTVHGHLGYADSTVFDGKERRRRVP